MKIACTVTIAALLSASMTEAFTSSQPQRQTTQLAAVVTGVKGKAATSREEDLMLTLQVILDHEVRSSTVSKEEYVQQMEKAKQQTQQEPKAASPAVKDVSVPYQAAGKLAYEAAGKPGGDFEAFYQQYLADTVAMVSAKAKAKQQTQQEPKAASPAVTDVSVPYQAAGKLAYEAAGKPGGDFEAFYKQYLADAVALVKSKQKNPEPKAAASPAVETSSDTSVPYDAAAMLAYEAEGKPGDFTSYKAKYLKETVDMIKAKQK